jgi:hypothetical protein
MPRAWTVSTALKKESTEIFPLILQPSFDPFQTAYIEEDPFPSDESARLSTVMGSERLDDIQKNTEAPPYTRRSPILQPYSMGPTRKRLMVIQNNFGCADYEAYQRYVVKTLVRDHIL